jgi:hypothetical protein
MEGGEATRVLGVEKHADEGASGHRFLKWVVRHPSWVCGGRAQSVDLAQTQHLNHEPQTASNMQSNNELWRGSLLGHRERLLGVR